MKIHVLTSCTSTELLVVRIHSAKLNILDRNRHRKVRLETKPSADLVSDEVRGDVASVNLHAFLDVHSCLETVAGLNRKNTIRANLV